MGTNNNALTALATLLGLIPEFARQYQLDFYSDLFKSYNGFRPRWIGEWTLAEVDEAIERLAASEAQWAHEESCELCYQGECCRERLPTGGEGWAFTPAA